jgi:hypothetical protein
MLSHGTAKTGYGRRGHDPGHDLGTAMEDAGHEGAAATENWVEGEGYGIVKAATADWEGTQLPMVATAGILPASRGCGAGRICGRPRPDDDGRRGRGAGHGQFRRADRGWFLEYATTSPGMSP